MSEDSGVTTLPLPKGGTTPKRGQGLLFSFLIKNELSVIASEAAAPIGSALGVQSSIC